MVKEGGGGGKVETDQERVSWCECSTCLGSTFHLCEQAAAGERVPDVYPPVPAGTHQVGNRRWGGPDEAPPAR